MERGVVRVETERERQDAYASALRESGFEVAEDGESAAIRVTGDLELLTVAADGVDPIRLAPWATPSDVASVVGLVATVRELARDRHDLEAAATSQLVARMLAHDANNMLTVILATVDCAEPVNDARVLVADAAKRLAALLRRLMAPVRHAEAARATAVDEAARELLPLLEALASGRRVTTRFGRDLPSVCIDPVDLERALVNLVANARHATSEGDEIRIDVELADYGGKRAWVVVSVEDYGAGMDAETAARAIEPHFTTRSRGRGGGLGLASVARIARAAGGDIRIASSPGTGTRVSLWLPARDVVKQGAVEVDVRRTSEKLP